MNAFPIHDAHGELIETLGRWREAAPPRRSAQWSQYGSARALAERWRQPAQLHEIDALLDSAPATRGFEALVGKAMLPTRLDRHEHGTRKHDLLVVGRAGGRRTVLSIDPRSDELYGRTIEERILTATPGMKIVERAEHLARLVFCGPPEPFFEVRYHFLVAAAATILEAQRHDAAQAVYVVHELRPPALPRELFAQNAVDFDLFVRKLTHGLIAPQPGRLVGPIEILGDGSRLPLYLGRAITELE